MAPLWHAAGAAPGSRRTGLARLCRDEPCATGAGATGPGDQRETAVRAAPEGADPPARVEPVAVDRVGRLLGDDEDAAVGPEAHLRRPGRRLRECPARAVDVPQPPVAREPEAGDVRVAAGVERVDEPAVGGDADR